MHAFKNSEITIPHQKDNKSQYAQFESNPPHSMILIFANIHDCINHQEVECMQWTNVVKNVGVTMRQTQEDDQEIQSPQHLKQTW